MHILTPIYASNLVLSLIRSRVSLPPPFPRCISMRDGRSAKPQLGSRQRTDYCYYRLHPLERVTRSVRCSGRVGRYDPRTPPCEGRPRARSLAALSAAQRSCLPQLPRPRLPWPQTRPPSPSREPLALRSARPCNRARPASHRGCGAWRGRFWRAAGDICARSETARLVGRWVEATRAVHSRLRVVCELACPLERAPELSNESPKIGAGGDGCCERYQVYL